MVDKRETSGSKRKTRMRYFLDTDCSGHWYIVPVTNKRQWDNWTNIDEEDERSWKVPKYVQAVGGHPSIITFTDPQQANK